MKLVRHVSDSNCPCTKDVTDIFVGKIYDQASRQAGDRSRTGCLFILQLGDKALFRLPSLGGKKVGNLNAPPNFLTA